MTVNSGVNKISYVGSSSQTLYPIPFSFIKKSDIKVSIYTSANVFVENWVYSTQYIIDANNNVSILSGYEIDNTKKMLIIREVDYTQENVYREGGDFPAKSTETSFDKSAMMCSQLAESIGRSLLLPEISSISGLSLPTPGAGKALKWNANEDGLINTTDDVDEIVTLATAQATIATTKASEASASATSAANSLTSAQALVSDFEDTVDTATSAFNTNATTKTDDFNTNATAATTAINTNVDTSRKWAEGTDSEVQGLGGVHSSKVWSETAQTIVEGAITTIEGNIGDIGFSPLGIDETQNKRRYLNGQVISQAQFQSFTTKVKSAVALYSSLATTEANWQAEVTNSKLGQCGKFVIDDVNGTIRLPKVVNVQGLADLALMGGIKAESLPNIKGSYHSEIFAYESSGAFIRSYGGTNKKAVQSAQTTGDDGFTFDASRSSSTYKNGAPVQQEAIQYPYFIQVATGVEETLPAIREYEINTPFFFGQSMYSDVDPYNASWLLSNGQDNASTLYPDFWTQLTGVELNESLNVGDTIEISGKTYVKRGLSVVLSTDPITGYEFVVNTADSTFKLPLETELGTTPAGCNLYYYVGDTVQDASLINAGAVLGQLANKANVALDNVSATGKETVVGWGDIDWSRSSNVTSSACVSSGTGYNPPKSGMLVVRGRNNNGQGNCYIYNLSGVEVYNEAWNITSAYSGNTSFVPVSSDYSYRWWQFSDYAKVVFVPYKGV